MSEAKSSAQSAYDAGCAFITFTYDDGRLNNYKLAVPLHEKYSVPANFAIIANRALDPGQWGRHMNPHQIVDASNRGIEISSHGLNHEARFTDLNEGELKEELSRSKLILEGLVGEERPVRSICIPFSRVNDDVVDQASSYYQIVRGKENRLNDVLDLGTNFVNSYGLTNRSTFEEVKELVDEAVAQKKWLVLMLHGVVDTNDQGTLGRYDVSTGLLDSILSYVRGLGENVLKAVTLGQVAEMRETERNAPTYYRPEIQGPGAYRISESEGFRITYHKNTHDTDTVMITFGGLPSKISSKGFGSNFALKSGYDHIFVAQAAGSQYQRLSLEVFAESVQEYLLGKSVVTYGSSLGAYAALYYGGAVNAKIIAAAPKNSAHPSMRKRRFSDVAFEHAEIRDNPVSEIPPLLLYDPNREEETGFIESVVSPAYPDAIHYQMPFAGHTVLATMRESGVLKDFITTYIQTGEVLDVELASEDSYIWHAEMGRYFLGENDLAKAEDHFRTSLSLADNGEAAGGLVKTLLAQGRQPEAKAAVQSYYARTGRLKGITKYLLRKLELEELMEE